MNIIEIKGVDFSYQGSNQKVLKDINLTIKQGEFILLTGRSGCGKTTLTRLLNGLVPHFFPGTLTGSILVNGKNIQETSTYELAQWIGSVFQDPRSQFFTTNTLSEVAFGCENLNFPTEVIKNRVDDAFNVFEINHLKNLSIFNLSSGEKQMIALGSTYAIKPSIFLFDEPSANLDMAATKRFGKLLKELKNQGATIIVSEHRLYYLMDMVDRIIYMKEGEIVKQWLPEEAKKLTKASLQKMGLRAFDIELLEVPETIKDLHQIHQPSFEVCQLRLDFSKNILLQDISFSVEKNSNQIIGIIGANGVGKTTLVKCLCGLIKRQKGSVKFNGKELTLKKRTRALYFVMQDTDYQLFTESVSDELSLGNEKMPRLEEKIDQALQEIGLKRYKDTHPMALSGGQKQRVTIATAAVNSANVLFFDEPTSGLDGENMRSVSEIIKTLNSKGKLVFIISHDYEFLLNTCNRVIHIDQGIVSHDFSLTNSTREKLKELLFLI